MDSEAQLAGYLPEDENLIMIKKMKEAITKDVLMERKR